MENQHYARIKIFQSGGGAEFTSNCFQAHLRNSGIHHQLSCSYTPAQNGRAERKTPSRDPGCPTISCMIGASRVDRALLDLGASLNLLPHSVYQKLGLGQLKPTPMTLQLADRSVKVPRGVVENVLIQVDKFYFPIDFIVIDTEPIA